MNLRRFAVLYTSVMFSGRNKKKRPPHTLGANASPSEYPRLPCPCCSSKIYDEKKRKYVISEVRHAGSPRCFLTVEEDEAFLAALLDQDLALHSKSLSKLQEQWNRQSSSLVSMEDEDGDEGEGE